MIYSDSTRDGHLGHLKSVKLSTCSIYFFGTPHQGGNGVSIAAMLLDIAAAVFNTNKDALHHLLLDSEYLQLTAEEFLGISADFEMKFFYEEMETDLPGGSSMIVSRFNNTFKIQETQQVSRL